MYLFEFNVDIEAYEYLNLNYFIENLEILRLPFTEQMSDPNHIVALYKL